MKKVLLALLTFCAISCRAQQFTICRTNRLSIAYEDKTIPGPVSYIISNDIVRLISPSIPFVTASPDRKHFDGVYLHNLEMPQTACAEWISTYAHKDGTNLVLTADKKFTDRYQTNMTFWAANSNKIAEAFAFAQSLATNPIPTRTDAEMQTIFLCKEFAPNALPTNGLPILRREYQNTTFALPSLLGFHNESTVDGDVGPGEQVIHFKGMLPAITTCNGRTDIEVIPIIYYRGHWWISFWNDEYGEQKW